MAKPQGVEAHGWSKRTGGRSARVVEAHGWSKRTGGRSARVVEAHGWSKRTGGRSARVVEAHGSKHTGGRSTRVVKARPHHLPENLPITLSVFLPQSLMLEMKGTHQYMDFYLNWTIFPAFTSKTTLG